MRYTKTTQLFGRICNEIKSSAQMPELDKFIKHSNWVSARFPHGMTLSHKIGYNLSIIE